MTYILYHANCMDGFASAYLFWKSRPADTVYLAVNYGQPPPEMPNASEIIIVDFSYDRQTLMQLYKEVNGNILVLDHHKTAEENLKGLFFCVFDQSKCGAILTWDYLFPQINPPLVYSYIQDRDLWTKKLPNIDIISAALANYLGDFEAFDLLMNESNPLDKLYDEGKVILKMQQKTINKILQNHYVIDGIPTCNSPIYQSEIGHQLIKMYPGAPYVDIFYAKQKSLVHSLRSDKGLARVTAEKYGGGGHDNAAGYEE